MGRQMKGAVLEIIGIWNKGTRRQHVVHQTRFEDDMINEALQVAWKHGTETPTMIHTYQLLDNKYFAPIGRIALYADVESSRSQTALADTP